MYPVHGQKGTSIGLVLVIVTWLMILCYANTEDLWMYQFLQEDSETSHTTTLTSNLRTPKFACCLCTGFIHITWASEEPWVVCSLWKLKQCLATAMSVLGGWWYLHTFPLPPGLCQDLRWLFCREGHEQRLVQKPGYFSVWTWDVHPYPHSYHR